MEESDVKNLGVQFGASLDDSMKKFKDEVFQRMGERDGELKELKSNIEKFNSGTQYSLGELKNEISGLNGQFTDTTNKLQAIKEEVVGVKTDLERLDKDTGIAFRSIGNEVTMWKDGIRADIAEWKSDMTRQGAETKMAFEELRADMVSGIAKRDVDAGERENRLLLAIIMTVGVAATVLGLLITSQ